MGKDRAGIASLPRTVVSGGLASGAQMPISSPETDMHVQTVRVLHRKHYIVLERDDQKLWRIIAIQHTYTRSC
jgi:hypothetical protein